jgi:hypothetical protein
VGANVSNKNVNHIFGIFVGAVVLVPAVLFLNLATARASITIVGNGDDGADLEGGRRVDSGILTETRDMAVAKLKRIDTQGIPNLGTLIPELERSQIYLVNRDIKPKTPTDRGMESSPVGDEVFARTFAEPHADTRFFPSALTLNQEQLIALHVHEALHRALPESIRENEEIVTQITLALTASDASFDRAKKTVLNSMPRKIENTPDASYESSNGNNLVTRESTYDAPPLEHPSSLTYSYRSYFIPNQDDETVPLQSLQSLQSFLYPFGTGSHALGVGVEFTYLSSSAESYLGPLQLSGRMRLLTVRGFDVGVFANYAMNTIASDELKNSPLGRDVTTVGLSARREASHFYVENDISISGQGDAKQKLGSIQYTHHYGQITSGVIRGGMKISGFEFGGYGEALVADSYRVEGGAFAYDSGRYRIVSVGPEISYLRDALKFSLAARWVIDKTKDASLDRLGDIMGHGMGQGSVSTSASFRF